MQTRALVDFGEASLTRAMRVYGPVGDLSFFGGKYYPSKAPLLSYAAVPIYKALRLFSHAPIGGVPEIPLVFLARLFLTIAPTLLCLALIRRFLGVYLSGPVTDALTVFYAFGTLAFSYSLLFMSHQTTAVLLFVAFFLVWRWSRSELPLPVLAAAGAFAALAVAAEYTSAMCAGLLAGYLILVARRKRSPIPRALALFAAGAAPVLALLMWYHATCFGGPLETGYRHLADAAYQSWHIGGFLGIKTPELSALWLSFFSPLRGFFALSPALGLGFVGVHVLWRVRDNYEELRPLVALTVLLILGYAYFTASFSYASWGWTTGPRHLTGLVPFLLLPAGLMIESTQQGLGRGICVGLIVGSIVVTGALTFVNYVPDDVSEGVFGLSVPLSLGGDLVPSLPNFLGWPNPIPALLIESLPMAVALAIAWTLRGERCNLKWVAAAILSLGLVLGIHRAAFRDSPPDRGALALLRQAWLTPNGFTPLFWSTDGRRDLRAYEQR